MKNVLKKSIAVLAIILVIGATLTSCGGDSSIVGQWSNSVNGVEVIGFTFTEDGKMSVSMGGVESFTCDYKVDGNKLIYTAAGVDSETEFSIKGDEMTITYMSVSYTLERVK